MPVEFPATYTPGQVYYAPVAVDFTQMLPHLMTLIVVVMMMVMMMRMIGRVGSSVAKAAEEI